MPDKPINVLFLCTHNSARSILAEAILNHLGKGRFKAFSAGSSPREHQQPNPMALEALQHAGISTEGLRSKNWDEFAAPDASAVRRAGPPQASTAPSGGSEAHEVASVGVIFDLVITVCDNAAGEVCPIWPGHPATAHWSYADPSETPGGDDRKREAFRQTLLSIHRRLELFINLPPAALERLALQTSARGLTGA
jgi:arsenate reductase (thioredoxin)